MTKRQKIDYYIRVHLGNSMNAIGGILRHADYEGEGELIWEAESALFLLLEMVHERYSDDEIAERLKELAPGFFKEESNEQTAQ